MFKPIFLGTKSRPVPDTPQRSEAGLGTTTPSPSSPAACKDRQAPVGIGDVLSLLWRGVGRDRPEAACPPGSRAAVGEAGGFNAVQKLLTNRASAMTARTTSGK
jgi:hypothetical protein